MLVATDNRIYASLKDFFGFDKFKGNQEAVIESILAGKDTFVIMPTGGGKSLCYQLPAIVSEGTAIIISPLIALMKNQVDLIKATGSREGIAHFLNSSLTKKQMERVKADVTSGRTKMLYLAPETLTKEDTLAFLENITVPFVAVDEAHCISEWGHDFRPEYRKIRQIVEALGNVPIIALTASATPKVQEDILKNMRMQEANIFSSSFNRPNLYYEVKPKHNKTQTLKEIISFLKKMQGKSGIIYCLSRKSVGELAETLRVNGLKALEYHAGMDAATRSSHQDKFLMEDVDVIVATIAFGMGIDKPDVRFVIHYDVPKSLESYYQETGRAGRDGIRAECLMFYNFNDLNKLEKFLKDKPVAEREVGTLMLQEVASFAESSSCRRKSVLHYFGEEFDDERCSEMCDNCHNPKEQVDAQEDARLMLETVVAIEEKFLPKHSIKVVRGEKDQYITSYSHDELEVFGEGADKDENFWKTMMRQLVLRGYLEKDIETYGTISITEKGKSFITKPEEFLMAVDEDYENMDSDETVVSGPGYDDNLYKLLKDLRKKIAAEKNLPPYIIFQDPSLEEMAIKYPGTMQDLSQITGVSGGKAARYGQAFLNAINKYVEENEIDRPDDIVVKSVVNKSALKVFIIQSVDRKLNLEDLSRSKGLTLAELLEEIDNIVNSGTKLNLDYYINNIIDEEYQEEIFDYFRTAETEDVDKAWRELGEDVYSREEIHMMQIKFISEMAH